MKEDFFMEEEKRPFLEHLDELRSRIVFAGLATLVGSLVCYAFLDTILQVLMKPVGELVFLKPTEAFITKLKCALFGGVYVGLPVILYQFWRFLLPALYQKEKILFQILIPLSWLLFILGSGSAFFMVLPLAMEFLLDAGVQGLHATIGFGYYITFVTYFLLAFGTVFQLPLIIFFLIRVGLVDHDFFSRNRRMAILTIFGVSALLTPPDIFTQILMAVPTIILYEASIWVSRLVVRKENSD